MSYSLNSLKGGYIGGFGSKLLQGGYIRDYNGSVIGMIKGVARSLDYRSHSCTCCTVSG